MKEKFRSVQKLNFFQEGTLHHKDHVAPTSTG